MKLCTKCVIPETNRGMKMGDDGVCPACKYWEEKKNIDWDEKREELGKILDKYRRDDGYYDCIIPVSGGKDSTYQVHVIKKEFNMNPLLVTFTHDWQTSVGIYNRDALSRQFDVDHIMFTPNPDVVRRITKASMKLLGGDFCWHCHAGIFAFTMRIAVKYGIPLLIYGDNYIRETGMDIGDERFNQDKQYVLDKQMRGFDTNAFVGKEGLTKSDLEFYELPSDEALNELGLVGLFLGDYIDWDGKKNAEFIKKEYGWHGAEYGQSNDGYIAPYGPVCEGTYEDFENTECKMPGVHDYLKFLKLGYGRASDHASMDIRRGLMTREKAMEKIEEYDGKRPSSLYWLLGYMEMTENEFLDIAFRARDKRIDKDQDGIWKVFSEKQRKKYEELI